MKPKEARLVTAKGKRSRAEGVSFIMEGKLQRGSTKLASGSIIVLAYILVCFIIIPASGASCCPDCNYNYDTGLRILPAIIDILSDTLCRLIPSCAYSQANIRRLCCGFDHAIARQLRLRLITTEPVRYAEYICIYPTTGAFGRLQRFHQGSLTKLMRLI